MSAPGGFEELDSLTDIEALRAIAKDAVTQYQQVTIDFKKAKEHIDKLERELIRQAERIALHLRRAFARMSEKLAGEKAAGQKKLFDEAEVTAKRNSEETTLFIEDTEEASGEKASTKSRRIRGKRAPLPETLPRVDTVMDISEEQKVCGCGETLVRIGEDISERLEVVPMHFVVRRIIRPRYACSSCGGTENEPESAVQVAPVPASMIPKSYSTPSLLATCITWKYQDALPLYRQEQIFLRHGIDISRATLSRWIIEVATRCKPLIVRLKAHLMRGLLINMDETPVQVHLEEGRADTTTSYMWVARGGPPGQPVLIYIYKPTRNADLVRLLLKDYQGVLQTDGYPGYDAALKDLNAQGEVIVHVGCMVHARREFFNAQKAGSQQEGATKAIRVFKQLYDIERECDKRGLEGEEKTAFRRENALPILKAFKAWLEEQRPLVLPQSLLGEAISYTLNQWSKLVRYIDYPFVPLDNNIAENAIRPFVIGRKNWLFSGSPDGAESSAALYSLIETAKANRHEPFHYLYYLFSKLPEATTESDFDALLPFNVKREEVFSYALANWARMGS